MHRFYNTHRAILGRGAARELLVQGTFSDYSYDNDNFLFDPPNVQLFIWGIMRWMEGWLLLKNRLTETRSRDRWSLNPDIKRRYEHSEHLGNFNSGKWRRGNRRRWEQHSKLSSLHWGGTRFSKVEQKHLYIHHWPDHSGSSLTTCRKTSGKSLAALPLMVTRLSWVRKHRRRTSADSARTRSVAFQGWQHPVLLS